MHEYLVYRTGSNAANQPMASEPVPVAIVRATSREEAAQLTWGDKEPSVHSAPTLAAEVVASVGDLNFYANQTAHAVPRSKAKAIEWNAVLEAAAMAEAFDD